MNSRERVDRCTAISRIRTGYRSICGSIRATQLKYGKDLDALLEQYPLDIVRLFGPTDRNFYPEMSDVGDIKDAWGSTWRILRQGINGEVKIPAIEDISKVQAYQTPLEWLAKEWQKHDDLIDQEDRGGP